MTPSSTNIITFTDAAQAEFWGQRAAARLYSRTAPTLWARIVQEVRRQPAALPLLDLPEQLSVEAETLASVPLVQIAGTASGARVQDFDESFRPRNRQLKERWLAVARRRQAGQPLPPVELFRVDEAYYVVDGHHRVSVEQALGSETIRARVTPLHRTQVHNKPQE